MEVPREVIFRHAFRTAADYFAGRIEEERRNGRVAVLIKEMFESLYFMPCNERGYPDFHTFRALELPKLDSFLTVGDISQAQNITVNEIEIYIEQPLLSQRYDYMEPPVVFMWNGRRMGSKRVPIEQLNVAELMRVAQVAVANREGLIIDEALKNKIYK